MKTARIKTLVIGIILSMILFFAFGGENADQTKDVSGTQSLGLLKNVSHFSDNDIRFRNAEGKCVFVDPVSGPDVEMIKKSDMTKPDLILITHSHGDHFQPEVISQYLKINPQVIVAGPKDVVEVLKEKMQINASLVSPMRQYEFAGLEFNTVPAYFDDEKAQHPKSNKWVGYVLRMNGARYYVTGDTQPMSEANTHADVVFPLLWGCGGNIDGAVEMAKLSQAKLAVPVHHGNQAETIKKYIAKLPKGAAGTYYLDGVLATEVQTCKK